jgi:hypothetical protein
MFILALGGTTLSAAEIQQDSISGSPGTMLEIQGQGFHPSSVGGNLAVFQSLIDDTVFSVPGLIEPGADSTNEQLFTVLIPPLPAGRATVTFINQSTGDTTDLLEITIEPAPALSQPASVIIDEFYAEVIALFEALATDFPEQESVARNLVEQYTQLREQFQELSQDTDPEIQQALEDLAVVIEAQSNQGALYQSNRGQLEQADACWQPGVRRFFETVQRHNRVLSTIMCELLGKRFPDRFDVIGKTCGLVRTIWLDHLDRQAAQHPDCTDPDTSGPPAPACTPSANGGRSARVSRGIGSAPPPGGNGCGNVAALPTEDNTDPSQPDGDMAPGRYTVKVFPRGGGAALSPFTGSNDAGGYFFLPFIPEGEPFTAVAFDNVNGRTKQFDGVGPAEGESVYMFFDFNQTDDIEPVFPSTPNVLAEFDFNNNVEDSSGNDRDAVLIGGEFVPTRFGLGLRVGGVSNSGIDWSNYANLLVHPYSIEMILTPQQTSSWRKLFSFDDSRDAGWYYRSEGIQAYPNPVIGSGQVKPNELHYLAFVSTAPDQIDVYFQGELLGSTNASFTTPPVQAIFFKDDTATGGENLEATIEALRISDVARTSDEIAAVQQILTSAPNVTAEDMHNK